MAPSSRSLVVGKRPLSIPPKVAATKRSKAPLSLGRSSWAAASTAGQSSILKFFAPTKTSQPVQDVNDQEKPDIDKVVAIDSDDNIEVTGVSPGRENNKDTAAAFQPATSPTSKLSRSPTSSPPSKPLPEPQPSLALPSRACSSSARQASLLRFFTTTGSGGNADEASADHPALKEKLPVSQQEQISNPSGTWPSSTGRTYCPPVKWVDGTDLTVDAFNYGAQARCRGYFLSHFHSDHYIGLGRKFDGHLFASVPTVEMARLRLGVRSACLRPLEMQRWYDVPGAQVILLDANHCPGSAMFLFRLAANGRRILHTGDFRAYPEMLASVRGWLGESPEVDSLYLDTTYCSPEYDFPPQCEVIQSVLKLVEAFVSDYPRYLIVCGSYALGKERIFVSVARHLGCQAGVDPAKFRLLSALGDPGISEWIVRDSSAGCKGSGRSRLQIIPLRGVTHAGLRRYLADWRGPPVDAVLGISPTGWSLDAKGVQVAPGLKRIYGGSGCPLISVYAAAYSEHSSFGELRDFVRGLRPRRILPTVGWHKREACMAMRAHFERWLRDCR